MQFCPCFEWLCQVVYLDNINEKKKQEYLSYCKNLGNGTIKRIKYFFSFSLKPEKTEKKKYKNECL